MNAKSSRMFHWPVLVIGVLLIVLPFTVSMPSRTSAGQKLLNAFHPIMQPASVRTTVSYDVNTFTPLGPFASGAVAAAPELPKFMAALATALHMTPAQLQAFLGKNAPTFGLILTTFPKLVPIFTKVPPGLAFYKPIVDTMQAQVNNFAAVDSLPNLNLFTWFLVVPGILLVLLAGLPLLLARRRP
ncbi:MAG TPA: hypothetical protein VED84_05895 [Acidimicrobiales bacterium]|nr:hypothetical protein [Acidimicrobiales bacterium]